MTVKQHLVSHNQPDKNIAPPNLACLTSMTQSETPHPLTAGQKLEHSPVMQKMKLLKHPIKQLYDV